MINPAELGRFPVREPRIFTDEQVKNSVRGNIEYVVRQVQFPVRAFVVDARSFTYLFDMQGQGRYSLLKNLWGDVQGRVEAGHTQELAFEVMREFGFDPNNKLGEDESRSYYNKQIIQKTTTYGSRTIGGLVFDRIEESTAESERPFRIEWRARDAARRFRIGSKEKVKVA